MRALPKSICAAYSCALARGSPAATPPSASASMNWYAHAGPQPDTLLAASIRLSATSSSRPAGAMAARQASSACGATPAWQYWIIPAPTATGVLGIMRITG